MMTEMTDEMRKKAAWTPGDLRTVGAQYGVTQQTIANWRTKWGNCDPYVNTPGATTVSFEDWVAMLREHQLREHG